MSLNWSTQRVKYFDDNPDKLYVKISEGNPDEYEDVNAETKGLIFGSMSIGFGTITEKNASEWYARWKMLENYDKYALCSVLREDGKYENVYLTPEIVIKHIGLSTNVSLVTTANWSKKFCLTRYNPDEDRPTYTQTKAMITVLMMEFDARVKTLNKEMEKV